MDNSVENYRSELQKLVEEFTQKLKEITSSENSSDPFSLMLLLQSRTLEILEGIQLQIERVKPLLEKYERAEKANRFLRGPRLDKTSKV